MNNHLKNFYGSLIRRMEGNIGRLEGKSREFRDYMRFPDPIHEDPLMIGECDKVDRNLGRLRVTKDLLIKIFGDPI